MTMDIFYFSGSGNSLAVARDLAKRLKGRLIPAGAAAGYGSLRTDAPIVGFVFPIYDFKPPELILDLVSRIENPGSRYVFAICTYGIAPGGALKAIAGVLERAGGSLSAGFAVAMPHNGIGSGRFKNSYRNAMLEDWKQRADDVAEYISSRNEGIMESGGKLRGFFTHGRSRMLAGLFRFLYVWMSRGIDALELTTDASCSGCRVCEKVCPVGNICLEAGRPVWGDHCAGCFACLHWCPEGAVSPGGVNLHIKRYHHPDISLADMIPPLERNKNTRV